MKKLVPILPLLILAACGGQEARTDVELKPYDFTYRSYAKLLSEFVIDERIAYASLKEERAGLDTLVETLASADLSQATATQKLAFYINAYNILTLRSVIDAYPVESIKDIDGVWDKTHWTVASDKLTLNDIEHEILRKKFDEPRIHVAVNCASIGCPPLLNAPYYPDSVDAQLEFSSRRFASSSLHNSFDFKESRAQVSAIFDWFGDDFAERYYDADRFPGTSKKENASLNFLLMHLELPPGGEDSRVTFDITYNDYDWSLNDLE
ncbi:MAG: DUF547 domain-containing protein [candidate division Zixibacteria bacterium]|nr:DUF547 domain-containing protein [candidate division Zixibacteria bacterium]MDH3936581.1 DUF547 domain-containing protein [candidate division Zixibacteria bacterium]MDH4034210.1 DUF547 domain-containing protein [candidate division Zixibacteria bacterium]